VYSAPAVADGVVYVGSLDQKVYALDARTGALLWEYATGDWVESSPAVANGMVFIGSFDHNLYAFRLPHAGQVKQEGTSPPNLTTLRRDLNLKVSPQITTRSLH
jgi:outer membrane protein assembly factor BamB